MSVTPEVFRAFLQPYVGWEYGFWDRCNGSHHEFDCSGIQCHGTNGTGLTRNVCTSSFVMASECWNLGLYMTEAQVTAENGPDGWWAFHGANYGRTDDGSRPNGASGHVVYVIRRRDSSGKTLGFYTIEAMGRRYGVVNGQFYGRGWTGHYRIPGMDHTSQPTFFTEMSMITQTAHYDAHGKAIPIADKHTSGPKQGQWILATIGPTSDGKALLLKDGASFTGAGKQGSDSFFAPPEIAQHGKIVSVARWAPREGVPGLIVRFNDGHQKPYRFT